MALQFNIGDKAFYPSHGVGVITAIEPREIGGSRQDFYILRLVANGATFMVSKSITDRGGGIRKLASNGEVENIYSILRSPRKIPQKTWNRRFRELKEKLDSGSLMHIAEVIRDLSTLKNDKTLSFGEKGMLEKALKMIVCEISAACCRTEDEVYNEVNQILLPN